MSNSGTTPDSLYTYADDDDLFIADSATVTRLLALLAPPYVGRHRVTSTRDKLAGWVRDALDPMTDREGYVARHGAGVAK